MAVPKVLFHGDDTLGRQSLEIHTGVNGEKIKLCSERIVAITQSLYLQLKDKGVYLVEYDVENRIMTFHTLVDATLTAADIYQTTVCVYHIDTHTLTMALEPSIGHSNCYGYRFPIRRFQQIEGFLYGKWVAVNGIMPLLQIG